MNATAAALMRQAACTSWLAGTRRCQDWEPARSASALGSVSRQLRHQPHMDAKMMHMQQCLA